jgi:hypothetical protein
MTWSKNPFSFLTVEINCLLGNANCALANKGSRKTTPERRVAGVEGTPETPVERASDRAIKPGFRMRSTPATRPPFDDLRFSAIANALWRNSLRFQ